MLPEFYFLGLEMSTYGFVTAIGIIFMAVVSLKLSEKRDINYIDIILGLVISLSGGFLGAHLLYALVNIPAYLPYYKIIFEGEFNIKSFFEVLYHHLYGMVFYGGLIFALITGVLYCRARKINLNNFSDCFAVSVPLFHCFGRIGCFLSGCCYGIESRFGFTTTNALASSCNGVNRFPVQLLESSLNLVLFAVMLFLFYKGILKGRLMLLYLMLYSVIRFCDEFLRGDIYRGIWLSISTSQWISIGLFIFSTTMFVIGFKSKKQHLNT